MGLEDEAVADRARRIASGLNMTAKSVFDDKGAAAASLPQEDCGSRSRSITGFSTLLT